MTHLLQNGPYVLERQRRKLVLLEKIVKVLLQHLKDQAGVVLVLKALKGPHKIELVGILLAEARKDRYLDLALPRIRRMVFQDLDGHDLGGAALPALDHLAKGAAAQELKDLQTGKRRLSIRRHTIYKAEPTSYSADRE